MAVREERVVSGWGGAGHQGRFYRSSSALRQADWQGCRQGNMGADGGFRLRGASSEWRVANRETDPQLFAIRHSLFARHHNIERSGEGTCFQSFGGLEVDEYAFALARVADAVQQEVRLVQGLA